MTTGPIFSLVSLLWQQTYLVFACAVVLAVRFFAFRAAARPLAKPEIAPRVRIGKLVDQ